MEFLEVKDIFMPGTIVINNDNKACVQWSKLSTTKGDCVIYKLGRIESGKMLFLNLLSYNMLMEKST